MLYPVAGFIRQVPLLAGTKLRVHAFNYSFRMIFFFQQVVERSALPGRIFFFLLYGFIKNGQHVYATAKRRRWDDSIRSMTDIFFLLGKYLHFINPVVLQEGVPVTGAGAVVHSFYSCPFDHLTAGIPKQSFIISIPF